MTKYQLHQLADKFYWDITQRQQNSLWVDIVADGLGTGERGASYIIRRIRSLPFGDDQVREAANLLACVSEGYFGRGQRGHRPILATMMNVAKLSGASTRGEASKWHHNFPNYSTSLIDLRLSPSNPYAWGTDVEFTPDDIYRGIYIATTIGHAISSAIGLAYADGYTSYSETTPQLRLGGGRKDTSVYKLVVPKVLDDAFNFLYEFPEDIPVDHNGNQYTTPRIVVASQAISTYLMNWIGFPRNKEERAIFEMPEKIKALDQGLKRGFLMYYTSFKPVFSPSYGHSRYGGLRFTERSRKFLEDLVELYSRMGIKPSMSVQQKTPNSYVLNVSEVSTLQMLMAGLFNANERLKNEVEQSFPPPREWGRILQLR